MPRRAFSLVPAKATLKSKSVRTRLDELQTLACALVGGIAELRAEMASSQWAQSSDAAKAAVEEVLAHVNGIVRMLVCCALLA